MKILRKILKGLSVTAALFVFQACYGTPSYRGQVPEDEVETTVTEEDTKAAPTEESGEVPLETAQAGAIAE